MKVFLHLCVPEDLERIMSSRKLCQRQDVRGRRTAERGQQDIEGDVSYGNRYRYIFPVYSQYAFYT